jgi:hypothetical protein
MMSSRYSRKISMLIPAVAFVWCIFYAPLYGQIQINGEANFELSRGGEDSRWTLNEIPNDFHFWHLSIYQLNVFGSAVIDDEFFFDTRVQFDKWQTGTLNAPRIAQISATWRPSEAGYSITAGRFISPLGLYPKRQLQSQTNVVNMPLAYSYYTQISETLGFWTPPPTGNQFATTDSGLTTAYYGGYLTGAMAEWVVVPNTLTLIGGITNTTPGSLQNYLNTDAWNVLAKVQYKPSAMIDLGVGISTGNYMRRTSRNDSVFTDANRARQTLIVADIVLADGYWEVSGEFLYSMWRTPKFARGRFIQNVDRSLFMADMANYGWYVDARYEPPFASGVFLTARWEGVRFADYVSETGQRIAWENTFPSTRYTIGVGYKLSRGVQIKAAGSYQTLDNGAPKLDLYTVRAILSMMF